MAKTIQPLEPTMLVDSDIRDLIYVVRGQQVMLDRDLATLYGVETKRLNEQVKRNIKRFPEDFMFQPTQEECLRSQIATSNEKGRGGTRYAPYVFTENGVAMLSGILRSEMAIGVNIKIMRAFTKMRHFLVSNASVFQRLETIEHHQLEMQLSQHDMQQHLQSTDKRLDEVFRLSHDRFLCIDEAVCHVGIHQGLGQEVVWILQDGTAFSRRIGGENQPRMKAKS